MRAKSNGGVFIGTSLGSKKERDAYAKALLEFFDLVDRRLGRADAFANVNLELTIRGGKLHMVSKNVQDTDKITGPSKG